MNSLRNTDYDNDNDDDDENDDEKHDDDDDYEPHPDDKVSGVIMMISMIFVAKHENYVAFVNEKRRKKLVVNQRVHVYSTYFR